MKKNRIRLSESQLHKVIKESVKRALNEGHWNNDVYYDKFEQVREMVGDDTFISELYRWMDAYSIEGFIKKMNRNYELGMDDENEEEYDEEY